MGDEPVGNTIVGTYSAQSEEYLLFPTMEDLAAAKEFEESGDDFAELDTASQSSADYEQSDDCINELNE